MRFVAVAMLGAFWLGCAGTDPSEVETPRRPGRPPPPEAMAGGHVDGPVGGSTGGMPRALADAYRRYNPGPEDTAKVWEQPEETARVGERTAVIAGARTLWGSTPHYVVALPAEEEVAVVQ